MLYSRNYHSTVNQLDFTETLKKKKEKSDAKSIQYLNRKVHLNIKILKQETFGKIINSIRLKYS